MGVRFLKPGWTTQATLNLPPEYGTLSYTSYSSSRLLLHRTKSKITMKFASMGPGSREGSSETHTVVDSLHVTLLVLLAAEQLSHHRLGTYLEQLSEARPKFIGSCNDWIWGFTLREVRGFTFNQITVCYFQKIIYLCYLVIMQPWNRKTYKGDALIIVLGETKGKQRSHEEVAGIYRCIW
jgi:hypothetical protein